FLHFVFAAGDFDGDALRLHIHDLGPENIGDLHDFGARLRIDLDLDQRKFAIHIFAVPEINHLEHVHQFVELLDDLLQGRVVPTRDNGHTGGAGVLRRSNVERVDVVAPTAE